MLVASPRGFRLWLEEGYLDVRLEDCLAGCNFSCKCQKLFAQYMTGCCVALALPLALPCLVSRLHLQDQGE